MLRDVFKATHALSAHNLFKVSLWLPVNFVSKSMATSANENKSITMSSSAIVLRSLFEEAVQSVQPRTLINKQVKFSSGHLSVNGQSFPLSKKCYMVGFGKAVLGMAIELERSLGDELERAVVTVPAGIFEKYQDLQVSAKSGRILYIEGAENNIPDESALKGAVLIKELVETLKEDDLLLVLISGGGSALLPLPKPPVTLEEKQAIIKSLSRKGATIRELNTVRSQLSVLKGGGLAKLTYPARIVSLILSDVVGDPIDIIASGPTVYSQEPLEKAVEILDKYNLYDSAPASIKSILESQSRDGVTAFETSHVSNFIIGTNKIATRALRERAVEMGWQSIIVSHEVEEDVNKLAEIHAQLALHIANGRMGKIRELLESISFNLEENAIQDVLSLYANRKILLIFAGEPTVSVTGSGKGGRNQQLALAFSVQLNKLRANESSDINCGNISLLSAGTDGIDGPTDAAGAIGSTSLITDAERVDAESYLAKNDSYNFFNRFYNGDFLIKIGHTGTNVMDLHLLLIEPYSKQ